MAGFEILEDIDNLKTGLDLKSSQISLDNANTSIGELEKLTTNNKTSLVEALNENTSELANMSSQPELLLSVY